VLTTKIRSIIAIVAVGATLASSGVASAATVTTQPTTPITAAPPNATAPMVEYVVIMVAVKDMLDALVSPVR
jgi:hypothetical protein